MDEIIIREQEATDGGMVFLVQIGEFDYAVTLDAEYLQELTNSADKAEQLVRKSFEFLLEREPKESILSAFNLRQIKTYFPDYEKQIQSQFQ